MSSFSQNTAYSKLQTKPSQSFIKETNNLTPDYRKKRDILTNSTMILHKR